MVTKKRTPVPRNPGIYTIEREDGAIRYGAVVDVRSAWGKQRIQRRRETFTKLAQAKAWRTAELAGLQGGQTAAGSGRTFGWWVQEWLELREGDLEFVSLRQYRNNLAKFEALNDTPLEKIVAADIEAILVRLRTKLSPGSVILARTTLATCLNTAVNLGLLQRNPVHGTSRPRMDRGTKKVWGPEEVNALLEATRDDERWGMVWRLLAETWMRVGEVCGLRWGDVDLSRGEVRVQRTLRWEDGQGWQPGTTAKTKAAVRTLPLSPELVTMLRQYQDRQRFAGASDLVIGLNPDQVRPALHRACDLAGLERIAPHMLRHAGATMGIRAGLSERVVQQRLGHTKVSFTLETYVHPSERDHRAAGDVISDLLKGVR